MKYLLYLIALAPFIMGAQNNPNEFTFEEYLGYVKKFHPLVKQANLKITEAQAELMKARGAFDPKLEANYDEKQYENSNYYSIFDGSFKIPTWYGIEIKAAFDNNEGIYINPENTLPNQGLTSVGIAVPIGQGLWINERMAGIRKAKLFQKLNEAERNLMLTEVLFQASNRYINWKRSYDEVALYKEFLENAQIRYDGVIKSIEFGDKPAIDSVEAGITIRTRALNLENAKLKLLKAKLELSNFLWTEDNVPLELENQLFPQQNLKATFLETLNLLNLENISLENHPKINALLTKIDMLKVDKKLKANSLLPKIDLSYNYLSEPSAFDNYRFEDYKIGVNFYFPLFLRKERAELKLAKLKIQDSELGLDFETQSLNNKINAQQQEINSFTKQMAINNQLVSNFTQMLEAEDRLFEMGESSLFIINTRENSLVSAKLSEIALENSYLASSLELFRVLANPE